MNHLVKLKKLDNRIPKWNQPLAIRSCPLCNIFNTPRFIRPDLAEISLCNCCNLWYVSKGPDEQSLNLFYANYHSLHSTNRYEELPFVAAAKSICSPSIISEYIRNSICKKHLSVLDFGCGTGKLLFELQQRGHIVTGVEIDPGARQVCLRKGIKTFQDIQELESTDINFDVIVLSDVIEHLLHPKDLMLRLCRLLKDEGCIIIISPNGGKISLDNDPICLRVDLEHMQYFTCKSYMTIADYCDLSMQTYVSYGDPSLTYVFDKINNSRNLHPCFRLAATLKFHVRSLAAILKYLVLPGSHTQWPPRMHSQYHSLVVLQKTRQ